MKTLNVFVVELDKLINDTINVGGKEMFIDTRFEMGEFNNRVNEGVITSPPVKYNTGAKKGDTLYFHHHVVLQGGQKLFGDDSDDKQYVCMYDNESIMANQAIAYKCQDTGEVHPFDGWIIMTPHKKKRVSSSDILEEVYLKEDKTHKGRLAFENSSSKDLGINIKEIVVFKEGIAYPFKIDGEDYIRVSAEMVDYVQEEVHDA